MTSTQSSMKTMTTTTTCPSWCIRHPEGDPETHTSDARRHGSLTVSMESTQSDGVTINVDHGMPEYLDLTPYEAAVLVALLSECVRESEEANS